MKAWKLFFVWLSTSMAVLVGVRLALAAGSLSGVIFIATLAGACWWQRFCLSRLCAVPRVPAPSPPAWDNSAYLTCGLSGLTGVLLLLLEILGAAMSDLRL